MQKKLLERYVSAVMHAPASLNLTAAHDEREFWERHVLDALRLLELLPKEIRSKKLEAIDIGSGNGIPGIPIAIAMPDWQVTMLDSNNKKCGFLDMFCNYNSLKNALVLVGRAEAMARDFSYRDRFDMAFGRALAKLPTALELCVPFLKIDGLLMIPHGPSFQKELAVSENALHELGANFSQSLIYNLDVNCKLTALIFRKEKETPDRYPRKSGIPKKHPL